MNCNKITKRSSAVSTVIKAYNQKQKTIDQNPTEIRIASTPEERTQAYELAYEEYLRKGYIDENSQKMIVDKNDLDLNHTVTINGYIDGEIAGTITINSQKKLPYESTWPNVIVPFERSTNPFPAEITRLAMKRKFRFNQKLLKEMFNAAFLYAKRIRLCTEFFIEVTPTHSFFYQNHIGFQAIATLDHCKRVKHTSATLLWINFDWEDKVKSKHNIFLGEAKQKELIIEMQRKLSKPKDICEVQYLLDLQEAV